MFKFFKNDNFNHEVFIKSDAFIYAMIGMGIVLFIGMIHDLGEISLLGGVFKIAFTGIFTTIFVEMACWLLAKFNILSFKTNPHDKK
jgi:hypothetical protein